jgi:signal transduction histidine kinase
MNGRDFQATRLDQALSNRTMQDQREDVPGMEVNDEKLGIECRDSAGAGADCAQVESVLAEAQRDLETVKKCISGGWHQHSSAILGNISDGVIVTARGLVEDYNSCTAKMLSLPESCDKKQVQAAVERLGIKKMLRSKQGQMVLKSGGRQIIQVRAVPAHGEDAECDGAILILRDITAQVELEKTQNEFLSAISHELRTPLTAIQNSVSNMLAGVAGHVTPKARSYLDIMEGDCRRLGHMINDLLDMAKLETGRMCINKRYTWLPDLIDKAIRMHAGMAAERHIQVELSIEGTIPHVYVDGQRILQVLANLLSNAIKYNVARGKVIVRCRETQGEVVAVVEDTGIGISSEQQRFIFNKFYQISRQAGPGYHGSGLGLALCNELMAAHGGRIWVESEYGMGSKFHISLPKSSGDLTARSHIEHLMNACDKTEQKFLTTVLRFSGNDKSESPQFENMMREMIRHLGRIAVMNRDMVVRTADNEIMLIIARAGKYFIRQLKTKIKDVTEEILSRSDLNCGGIVPMLGVALYPDDGRTLEEIEKKARIQVNRL